MLKVKKPVIGAFYRPGHDFSYTVYHPERDKMYTIEFEKYFGIKHFDLRDYSLAEKRSFLKEGIKAFEKCFDIPNDFSILFFNQRSEKHDFIDGVINYDKSRYVYIDHHDAHLYSAYCQMPFPYAYIFCQDGMGDLINTSYFVNRARVTPFYNAKKYRNGTAYNYFGYIQPDINNEHTNKLDIAGKLMGICAHGRDNTVSRVVSDYIYPDIVSYNAQEELSISVSGAMLRTAQLLEEELGITLLGTESNKLPKELAYDVAYGAQKGFENATIENFLATVGKRYLSSGGRYAVLTGGCALNVLANTKLQETFSRLEFWVPPNPNDVGLSIGVVYKGLIDLEPSNWNKRYTPVTPEVLDLNDLGSYNTEVVTKTDIVNSIRAGNIIGLMQGRVELGPRALGNRSILCDPSIPGMKDKLNAGVKFREWFRPFAPVCLKTEAEKYFIASSFKHTDHMSFIAKVRPKFYKQLDAITHVDGTARLQTVTENSSKFMFDLLNEFNGVLLNTSLNVQGKPIANSIADGYKILTETALDELYVEKEGILYRITK